MSNNIETAYDLIAGIAHPFAVFDTHMRYITYTEAWLEQLHLSNSEHYQDISHYELFPEQSTTVKALFQRCFNGETIECEASIFLKAPVNDATFSWVCKPWYTADATFGGMSVTRIESPTHTSVATAHATSTLAHDATRYMKFFYDSPEAFFIMTIENATIIDCNDIALTLLGGTKETILRHTPASLSPEVQSDGTMSAQSAAQT